MKSSFQKRIGMLGGGQLGKMFLQEAANYNAEVHILDPSADAPCAALTPRFRTGDFKDHATVLAFGEQMDILTIEFEDVNADALAELEKQGKKVFPQPSVLKIIQDKGLQKEFYTKNDIPTAPYFMISSAAEALSYKDQLPLFQKLRTSGYDGYGVKALKTEADLQEAFNAPSVLEQKADMEMELSVIVARNEAGETAVFPSVAMAFNPLANMVEYLYAPAPVSEEVEQRAQALALKVIDALGMVGILAVEMFLLKNGELWVNEVAPRPHNSGHHTIEANYTSQFEMHFRSISGLPLGNTALIQPAVMVNILGEPGYSGAAIYEGLEEALALGNVYIHLYGKSVTKPYRKMGHVTVLDMDIRKAIDKAVKIKDILKVKA
ncbi:MAG: 5-(carboxyamino)imidazole ribonucleotide synthase [Bacteroidia bacterium]|nr:5-(carboxyamino)imidazole ribonucleotide synthase [Bacteroidia bacterium]